MQMDASARLKGATTEAARAAILKRRRRRAPGGGRRHDAQLAEAYERGAVLSFYFAEQLRGLETSGFDITNFFSDMIASFQPTRESRRRAEYAPAVTRFREARARARAAAEAANAEASARAPQSEQRRALIKGLNDVDQLVRLKNYEEAETRLRAMVEEFRGSREASMRSGQVSSVSAQDAFDENLQAARLGRARSFSGDAIMAASRERRPAVSRAHAASGRILVFLERKEERSGVRRGDCARKSRGALRRSVEGKGTVRALRSSSAPRGPKTTDL